MNTILILNILNILFCLCCLSLFCSAAMAEERGDKDSITLNVNVWKIYTDKNAIDLNAFFQTANILKKTLSVDAQNIVAKYVASENLKSDAEILKAFNGNAAKLTSWGGVSNHQEAFPVMATTERAYRALDGPRRSVNTGFSMEFIPYLDKQLPVMIEYTIAFSFLDTVQKIRTLKGTVELPKVSVRKIHQNVRMQPGQTLLLAGFQHKEESAPSEVDSRRRNVLLVITIELESVGGDMEA